MNLNMLKQFGPDIWIVEQPSNFIGVPLDLRMTIIRNDQQQLTLHSVIPCNEVTHNAIQALGKITYLIVPNLEHTRFIAQWQQRYPEAQTYAPTDAAIEPSIDLNSINHNALQSLAILGMPRLQESVFFHNESKTLILTDLAFNLNSDMTLWGKCFMKLNGAYNCFTSSRILRSLIKDKNAFSSSIQEILQWDFEQIIIAHGTPITDDAKQRFRDSFQWAL